MHSSGSSPAGSAAQEAPGAAGDGARACGRAASRWSAAEVLPVVLVLLGFAVACALVTPLTDVPVIDDWAYAYSVRRLLESGRFQVLDFSCRYNLVQTLWGALFSLPHGVSNASLRMSTLALAAVAIVALYDLLRRRLERPWLAAAAVAVLAFNPVFFSLALSFMTDVQLLGLLSLSFWLFDRGVRRPQIGWGWTAAALSLAVAAYLVRELAVAAPFAMLAALAVAGPPGVSRRRLLGLAVGVVASFAAVWAWIAWVRAPTEGLAVRAQGLRYLLDVSPLVYSGAVIHLGLTTAFFASPLALATLGRQSLRRALPAAAVLCVLAAALQGIPFGRGEVLSPLGLGMSRVLLPGEPRLSTAGQALRVVALLLSALSFTVIAQETWMLLRRRSAALMDALWLLFAAAQLVLLMVLWLWQDRYYLILVPAVLWLLGLRAARLGVNRRVLAAGLAIFAALAVLGTRENFALSRTSWEAEAWLRRQGVPAAQIDAGYVLNGVRLYAEADEYAPGFPTPDVPFLYSKERLPYAISTTPLAGARVLRVFSWPRLWLSPAKLYVLRFAP